MTRFGPGGWLGLSLFGSLIVNGSADNVFYPDGHFDRVEQFTDYDAFQNYMTDTIPQGKTTFVRWIASTG